MKMPIPLLIAIAGLAAMAVGLLLDPRTALLAWLVTVLGWSAIPIGCLAILMMILLVPGGWRPLLIEPLAAGARLLPVAALCFIPLLAGMAWIYPWADPAAAAALPPFKSLWLSPMFFAVRAIVYFGVLIALQRALVSAAAGSRPAIAAGGLIAYALIGSLLGVDFAESLRPEFHSSIYGLLFLSGQWLAGLAFAILVALRRQSGKAPRAASGALITAILLWAYFHAMQYIVIWSGDIPLEARWYLVRVAGLWALLTWLLFGLQGAVPFLAMLAPAVRAGRKAMMAIAAITLAMRFAETAWLVLPPLGAPEVPMLLLLIAANAAVLGLGAAAFLHFAKGPSPADRFDAQWQLERRRI
jgi:hypothetical protein